MSEHLATILRELHFFFEGTMNENTLCSYGHTFKRFEDMKETLDSNRLNNTN